MVKRAIIFLGLITLFVGSAYVTTKMGEVKPEDIIQNETPVSIEEKNEIEDNNIVTNETVTASAEEVKVTPNTILTLKKYYKDCGHIIKDSAEVPEEMVNLTEEQVKENYKTWNLDYFSKEEIVLSKELESFCGEHYLLIEENGKVIIYAIDEAGSKTLLETTEIAFEYVPETDKIILKNGIYVYGKEELNKIREDFES